MNESIKNKLEASFEKIFWKSRIITLLAVFFSMFSALSLFIAGSYKIWDAAWHVIPRGAKVPDYNVLLIHIIGAIDLYLIALVLIIFSFGIYELFISKIDPARHDKEINVLEIATLDDLKNRVLKVIIMALIVHFFKLILKASFVEPIELLYMGLGIFFVSASTYFIRKIEK